MPVDLGPHAAFIIAAYLVTAAIIGALVVWAFLDHRVQRRALAGLETRGVARRPQDAACAVPSRVRTPSPGRG